MTIVSWRNCVFLEIQGLVMYIVDVNISEITDEMIDLCILHWYVTVRRRIYNFFMYSWQITERRLLRIYRAMKIKMTQYLHNTDMNSSHFLIFHCKSLFCWSWTGDMTVHSIIGPEEEKEESPHWEQWLLNWEWGWGGTLKWQSLRWMIRNSISQLAFFFFCFPSASVGKYNPAKSLPYAPLLNFLFV